MSGNGWVSCVDQPIPQEVGNYWVLDKGRVLLDSVGRNLGTGQFYFCLEHLGGRKYTAWMKLETPEPPAFAAEVGLNRKEE